MSPPALRRWDESGWPLLAARLVLGVVFVWLGALKAADPAAFLGAVRQFGVVSDARPAALNLLGATLPWVEIWCGALLLLGVGVRGAALTLLVLLVAFTAAILGRALEVARLGGLPLCEVAFDCGCGTGVVRACRKLLENLGLVALALAALLSRSRRFCLRPRLIRARGSSGPPPRSG